MGKLIEVAKAMAECSGLLWEKLPLEPDVACGYAMPEGCQRYWIDNARAAIQTLMTPTPEMQLAAAKADCAVENEHQPYVAMWQAMLHAILNEETGR